MFYMGKNEPACKCERINLKIITDPSPPHSLLDILLTCGALFDLTLTIDTKSVQVTVKPVLSRYQQNPG